ncbi:glycosyltransferase [Ideonella sp.]|jgi:hypothetical protein|uniref:glycosyltransferase n=1 Tax=Ideonella sp. TaxID=1929293 RepID=UPI0037C11AD0
MSAPRVLLVTFNRLAPADQGNARRILQLVGFYRKKGYEIDLVYHNEEGFDPALANALHLLFSRVVVVKSSAPKHIRQPEHICRIDDWYDPAIGQMCQHLHRLHGYQIVHVNYVWYAPIFQHFGPDVIKVLDTHDVFADRADKYKRAGMLPQWFSTSRAEEDAAIRLADAALAIQKEEAAEMVERGHQNILYFPYVELASRDFTSPEIGRRPLTLGYLGSGNDWNILSMRELVAQMRRRKERFPFPIIVAGGVSKHVRETPGIIKLGFVKELHTFYDAIDVAINPMVGGTGLKIKTVEPLRYGKPVITTPSGAQGLTHLWQQPILKDAEELLSYLVEHFNGPNSTGIKQLIAQAQATREALEAEYLAQVDRFSRWLKHRLN